VTQFLLAEGVDASTLPPDIKVLPILGREFLESASEAIFGRTSFELTTLTLDEQDFDTVFLQAQRDLIEGEDYQSTGLHKLLSMLTKSSKRFALWYGSDYEDLEPVHDLKSLSRVIHESLLSPSAEAYVVFFRE